MGIGRFAFTPILPMMQEDAGVSIAMGGWLASANYVGYLAGALSVIWWRIGATTGIRVGLAAIGLGTLAMGLEHHFMAWLALRALAGVASAWVLIYVSAWCLENLASLGHPALGSTVYAGVGAGIALAGALCLALMHVGAGSARAWIVLGALSIVLSLGIWTVFRPRAGSPGAGAERSGQRGMAWDRESLRLVLCYGAFGFGYIIPATFLPVMAKQVIRDPAIFGWSWPIFGAAAMGSTLGTSMLRGFITNRRLWIASHLVMAFGVALPIVWPGIVPIMLAALLVGGTFMVITMVGMQEARGVAGARATGLMAAMTAAFAVGQIAGPISVSLVVGAGGSVAAALVIACVFLVVSAYALT
ncbi:MAG: MFS transporter [Candidatus Rokuibacteriota bacterium]|nr:MAG: MFS transporter [Candidatus Rokubacteria bacterium]PYO09812.1 MAG: MFS transporter [Candidatus Rokubacteria bacterium]